MDVAVRRGGGDVVDVDAVVVVAQAEVKLQRAQGALADPEQAGPIGHSPKNVRIIAAERTKQAEFEPGQGRPAQYACPPLGALEEVARVHGASLLQSMG